MSVIFDPEEASKGQFQSIKKVQGGLVSIERKPSKFQPREEGEEWQKRSPSDQVEVTLEDTAILEMEEGIPEPELKDGKFVFWMTYAQPGVEKPASGTWYVRHFLNSGKKLGIFASKKEIADGTRTATDWQGKFVTLEKQTLVLFERVDKDTGETEVIEQTNFVFIDEEAAGQTPIEDYAREKVVGKNKSNALRAILMDNRLKNRSDIVQAARDGSLDTLLGLKADKDGVYQSASKSKKK